MYTCRISALEATRTCWLPTHHFRKGQHSQTCYETWGQREAVWGWCKRHGSGAFAEMMRRKISMPAHFTYDGFDPNLFHHFSIVASRRGVYSCHWLPTNLGAFGGQVECWEAWPWAHEYVCGLAQRIKRLEEGAQAKAQETATFPFSWVFGRQASILVFT